MWSRGLRCTFVLKPVIAELNDFEIDEAVEVMKDLVQENTCFSRLSLSLFVDRVRNLGYNQRLLKEQVGQHGSHVLRYTACLERQF